ncbi:hypothetical protein ABEB36_013141 [Hypothenemus hampei]|uniref:Tetratricopeptide repeat protein n=1 Tax=Hypothenemus hampei TaxID=57062 RepID=A0ABD1E6Z5_HYPHA
MENKIKVCSEILQGLKQIEKFSYENINIFLLFLEAIALEDSPQLGKDYLDKFKDEIIGSENAALAKTIRDRLFMHSEYNRVIEKNELHEEMMKLLNNNISCENFFQNLKNYMSQVSSKLETSDNRYLMPLKHFLKTPSEIEEMHKKKSFGTVLNGEEIRNKITELFKSCIKKIGNKPNAAYGDEIMFILIGNIIPNLMNESQDESNTEKEKKHNKLSAKGLEKIRTFRNDFFHNFHTHGEYNLKRNFILKERIRELLDYFFKYSLSQEVYKKFKNPFNLEQEVKDLLLKTQNDFKQDSDIEAAVLELLDLPWLVKYLKLMSVIDNECVAKEREEKRKESKKLVIHRVLTSIDRKRLYRKFKILEELKENDNDKLLEDLKTELKIEYGIWIPKCYLKKMFEYYMKDNSSPSQFEEIFYNDICALLSLKENDKLSTQTVIKIYDRFARREKISSLLEELELSNQAKLSIEKKLRSLRSIRNRFIDLSSYFQVEDVKKKKINIVVDTVKFTRNLLEMFDDHDLYPFLSASEDEIFCDEIFLDYLLNEEINITSNFLTELLQIKYMTPYVVKLVLEDKLTPTSEEFSVIIRNLLEKDIYVEYLKELLENSKTYNVYQEIGNQINKDNIQNIYNLFKDPKCITAIFGVLNNDAREILAQEAFKLLKLAVDELYNNEKYDLLLKLVDCLESVSHNKRSSNLDILQIQRTVARMKNKNGCHEDALKTFKRLKEELEMTFNDTEPDKLYLSLLFSSDIAYTNHLIGKYEDSYKGYKALYDNIMEQFKINRESQLSCEVYNEIILKSEKYQSILVFNSKCLNILKIRKAMAYELVHFSIEKHTFQEILIYYQDALEIYEEVYEINRINATRSQDILMAMRDIAFGNERIASLKLTSRKHKEMLNQALNHYYRALQTYTTVLEIQEKGLWKTHSANLQTVQNILRTVSGIARAHNTIGDLKQSMNPKEALQHYNKSLRMYEEVLNIEKRTLDEEHKYVLYTMNDIAHTNNNLARLKSENKREALQHYEEAIKIYEHILKIQIRLGEEDCKTKRTKENLRFTTDWKNRLIRKPTDPISWRC